MIYAVCGDAVVIIDDDDCKCDEAYDNELPSVVGAIDDELCFSRCLDKN